MTLIPVRDLPAAGLWRRLAAAVYDGLLLLALWFAGAGLAVGLHGGEAISPFWMQWIGLPLMWLATTVFYAWFWQHGGQTLGMRSWRIRLVGNDGRRLSWRDCLLRSLVGTLSWLAFGLGYLWVLVRGDTWHDRVSRTRVIVLPPGSE